MPPASGPRSCPVSRWAASAGRTGPVKRGAAGIRAVVFDVGETLVDETRVWAQWADWLGVPHFTFMAALGATISRGLHHREVFRMVRPTLDIDAERRRRAATGELALLAEDFYPDAVPCLAALHRAGYVLGIVGNQPSGTEAVLRELDVPLAFVGSSEAWGLHKPDPAFFARIATELDLAPSHVAYVGDRLDNDIGPAAAAGMSAVFIRRGPWALIQAGPSDPPEAALTIDSLADLPAALAELRPAREPSSGRTGGSRRS